MSQEQQTKNSRNRVSYALHILPLQCPDSSNTAAVCHVEEFNYLVGRRRVDQRTVVLSAGCAAPESKQSSGYLGQLYQEIDTSSAV